MEIMSILDWAYTIVSEGAFFGLIVIAAGIGLGQLVIHAMRQAVENDKPVSILEKQKNGSVWIPEKPKREKRKNSAIGFEYQVIDDDHRQGFHE